MNNEQNYTARKIESKNNKCKDEFDCHMKELISIRACADHAQDIRGVLRDMKVCVEGLHGALIRFERHIERNESDASWKRLKHEAIRSDCLYYCEKCGTKYKDTSKVNKPLSDCDYCCTVDVSIN